MSYRTQYERVKTVEMGGEKYLHIELSSGRKISFHDAMKELNDLETSIARWGSRAFKLMSDKWEWDDEQFERYVDHMEELIAAWRRGLEKRKVEREKRVKIAQLRNTTGRTEKERLTYLEKADMLERELEKED